MIDVLLGLTVFFVYSPTAVNDSTPNLIFMQSCAKTEFPASIRQLYIIFQNSKQDKTTNKCKLII